MSIEVEPTRTMDVTEVEARRELATRGDGTPKRPGMTPSEATGARETRSGPEPDPK